MRTLAIALVAILIVAAASAGASAASINRREHRQIVRIRQGVLSGQLTARETARLLAEQGYIRLEEARYRRSGGHLGPWERMDLQRDLNRASRHIYRQRHDAQHR